MKIGALARAVGLRPSALRYYEQAGVLPRPERSSRQRVYGSEALERLRLVRALQTLGFSLTEIRVLLSSLGQPNLSQRWKALARKKMSEIEATIATAQAMRQFLAQGLDCNCIDLRTCTLFARLAASPPPLRRGEPTQPRR